MGKKAKGNKKDYRGDSSDEEEEEEFPSNLTVEQESESTFSEKAATDTFDLSESIDMLSEKKMNLREPALRNIITWLQGSHDDEENLRVLNGYLETLTTHITRMIRRPATTKEGELCLELLALLALYLGTEGDGLMKSTEKVVLQHVQSTASPLQPMALFILSFASYVVNKEELLYRTLETVQNILVNETGVNYSDELITRATNAWILLSSLLSPSDVLERSKDEGVFEALCGVIEGASATSIASKVAVGRTIAYLYETADKVHPGSSIEELGYLISDDSRVTLQALESMRKIAKDSSKKVSKKNRKEQRAEFRDILDYIDDGEKASEVLRMQGADVTVEGFAQETVADALREVLGTGFQSALLAFPVVREIFEVEYLSSDGDVSSGRKASKGSEKARALDRRRDREMRGAHSTDFQYEG
eukprot:gene11430-12779_t